MFTQEELFYILMAIDAQSTNGNLNQARNKAAMLTKVSNLIEEAARPEPKSEPPEAVNDD